MTITSTLFLFLFFPVTLLGYYLVRRELKNVFLLLASILFYFLSDPNSIWIIVVSIAVNYLLGLGIGHNVKSANNQSDEQAGKGYMIIAKVLLILGLVFNFGMLLYYKYTGFALETANALFKLDFTIPIIGLPIGISFFTFRTVSYLLDVYWNTSPAQKNPINAALYISFFPQVTMGPITKYSDFAGQLGVRKFDADMFADGLKQMVLGLFKKVVFANGVGTMVDYIFDMPHSERTVVMAWLGIIGYLVQLYYDFGGYSDMAIGLGKLFGFKTPKNFDYPYASKSVAEFWNRWHITLGSWFRDYVFMPVSTSGWLRKICRKIKDKFGNKARDIIKNLIPLAIVWFFTGLWHGAAWHYVAWGAYQFAFILFERLIEINFKKPKSDSTKSKKTVVINILSHVYFIPVLIIGQTMFRIEGFWNFFPYVGGMFGIGGGGFINTNTVFNWSQNAVLLIVGTIFCFPVAKKLNELCDKHEALGSVRMIARPLFYAAVAVVAVSFVFTSTYQAFIYAQF